MDLILNKKDDCFEALCDSAKRLIYDGDFNGCESLIAEAMRKNPHAPQPHNLMGVLFEIKDDHKTAMKHFRAAWSLDPAYRPARQNLNNFSSMYFRGAFVFDERDCPTGDGGFSFGEDKR